MVYRLARQNLSRRQAVDFNKQVHALAHEQRTTALEAASTNFDFAVRTYTDNAPRSNHREKRIPSSVDNETGRLELRDEDVYDFKIDFPGCEAPKRDTDMTVSLLDMVKPSKRKGSRRNVTFIPLPLSNTEPLILTAEERRFINDIEDFVEIDGVSMSEFDFEDDWEEVYDERQQAMVKARPSYSAILRGHER